MIFFKSQIETRLDIMIKTFEKDKKNNGLASSAILGTLYYIKTGDKQKADTELDEYENKQQINREVKE